MDELRDKEAFQARLREEELKLRKEEQVEAERLVSLEQQLIKELKNKLFELLNERSQISDVRESDVKESELIDQQIQLAIEQA